MIYKLNKRELRRLEREVLKRVVEIVFGTPRPSGKQKVLGGLKITSDTGKLKDTLLANRNFITQNSRGGLEIDIKVTDYFQYLDDSRRDELNWYLSEEVFKDKKINDILDDILSKTVINATIEFIV